MSSLRTLFPFFNSSSETYLDTAATSQRLSDSLTAMNNYYENFNANVHRGNYVSAIKASTEYENARQEIADFIGAKNTSEVVFTSGATEALNLIANGLDVSLLQGKYILLCESEHHANLIPWQVFAAQHSLTIKKISMGVNGVFTDIELDETLKILSEDVAIMAIAHVSNVLGNVFPIEALCKKANEVNALSVIDGTQAAAHVAIDVQKIDCDFYCFSGHKMYAGCGIGALFGKMKHLEKLKPSKLGGEMITKVTWDDYELQAPPMKFEAGTPNIAAAIGFSVAAKFIKQNFTKIQEVEHELMCYLLAKLAPLRSNQKLNVLGNIGIEAKNTISLVSFVTEIHANDVSMQLATQNIAVRAGHHCAMPLMHALNIDGCVRVSMGCYTTKAEIDLFVQTLSSVLINSDETGNGDRQDGIVKAEVSSIETTLKNASDWNSKHRLLLLYSKELRLLNENERSINAEVVGCEAKVWLLLRNEKFLAYSNSKVIRGILALITNKLNKLTKKELSEFDLNDYLNDLGLNHYFSKGRRDGIKKIIQRIQELSS